MSYCPGCFREFKERKRKYNSIYDTAKAYSETNKVTVATIRTEDDFSFMELQKAISENQKIEEIVTY